MCSVNRKWHLNVINDKLWLITSHKGNYTSKLTLRKYVITRFCEFVAIYRRWEAVHPTLWSAVVVKYKKTHCSEIPLVMQWQITSGTSWHTLISSTAVPEKRFNRALSIYYRCLWLTQENHYLNSTHSFNSCLPL